MALRLICIACAANVTDGLSLLYLVYHVDEAVLKNFLSVKKDIPIILKCMLAAEAGAGSI